MTDLRSKVREVGARFCVAKNSLVKLALKDTQYEALTDFFSGPTAIVFSKDPISGIKAVKNYSDKNEKLKFVKASLSEKVIDTDEFIALAKLPSLEEIRASLVGYLIAPQQQLIQVFNAPGTEIVGVLDNYSKKK
jgi:large subunit ribosomal protein L10